MRPLIFLLFIGCDEPLPAVPSYAVDVQPILEQHCVRCHTADGRRDGGIELDQYASARSSRVSTVCTSLDPDLIPDIQSHLRSGEADVCRDWVPSSMPPGAIERLSLRDQDLLALWAATGAQP